MGFSNSSKGWRIVLTNGNTSGNQQGPIIALYTTETGGTEVYGSTFYGGERVVFSEGDIALILGMQAKQVHLVKTLHSKSFVT